MYRYCLIIVVPSLVFIIIVTNRMHRTNEYDLILTSNELAGHTKKLLYTCPYIAPNSYMLHYDDKMLYLAKSRICWWRNNSLTCNPIMVVSIIRYSRGNSSLYITGVVGVSCIIIWQPCPHMSSSPFKFFVWHMAKLKHLSPPTISSIRGFSSLIRSACLCSLMCTCFNSLELLRRKVRVYLWPSCLFEV